MVFDVQIADALGCETFVLDVNGVARRKAGVRVADTRRVIGITQRTDSLASPGAKLLIHEIRGRSPTILSALD